MDALMSLKSMGKLMGMKTRSRRGYKGFCIYPSVGLLSSFLPFESLKIVGKDVSNRYHILRIQ